MPLASYTAIGPDKLLIEMGHPLVAVLTLARQHPHPNISGTGPLATVSDDLAARDPLATMEAQFAADDLACAAQAASAAQETLVDRLLAAATPAGAVVALTTDQVLTLSGWANRRYVAVQAAAQDVEIGRGQDVFDDSGLAALLGEPTQQEMTIGLVPAVLAMFATELLTVHRAVLAQFS